MRLIIIFLFVCSSIFSQEKSIKYECHLKTGRKNFLLIESLELKPDSTFIWTSEYDLSFEVQGTYSIKDNILTLNEKDSIINSVVKTPFKTYFLEGSNIFFQNDKGKS